MKNQINFLYLIWIIHHCLGTVFELPSHGTQSHFQFLFKIEPLQGFHLSRGSSNMNIIKIGDIKIFAGTPGPASTHIGYIFAFNEPKWGQGTLGKQRSTLIGSRTRLGLDPTIHLTWPFIFRALFEFNPTQASPGWRLRIQKGQIRCIIGPWQGPLKDQGGSWTQWGSTFVSPDSLDPIFVA